MKDQRSRKWLLTINNPLEKELNHEVLHECLISLKSLIYYCMSDEIGENETYHTHIYMHFSNAVRFSTVKKKFPTAHIDYARGTATEIRDYVFKLGKWINTAKEETNLPDTHKEYGELPLERQGQRNDINDLYDMIKSGMGDYEIVEENPSYMLRFDVIEKTRQKLIENEYKNKYRELDVTYIWGSAGVGKTRYIMEKYGYENVYRVTSYKNPFDGYKQQDIIIFEEFRDSLNIVDMLNYLDGYPLELHCRYFNKIACYTKVYIITNIPLESQYTWIQHEQQETYRAFLRRIDNVIHFDENYKKIEEQLKIEGMV